MPILLVVLLAAFTLGWLDRGSDCEAGADDVLAVDLVDLDDAPAPPTWQAQCRARFEEARADVALITAQPALTRAEVRTDEGPGGTGSVTYTVTLPDGQQLCATVSGVQPGDVPDNDWYSLNGATPPADAFSYWKDQGGRSGAVAGKGGTAVERDAFKLVFQSAIDDCLELDE